MGRSTTSCFKIISCGGSNESVDRDEIDASSENKGPDKRGWSFRKKSVRHRVLSNTVVTEPPSSENKEISEPITIISEPQINSDISEKISDKIWTEEMQDSITKNATMSTMDTEAVFEEDDMKCEPVPDETESESESESAVLVIQAAVRRFLAERELVKHKNAVKLQAAVRGHLVRTHAVGTLRCVQAIVKMQALVRARQSSVGVKGVQNPTYISIEKLLSNKLARQLLESTPKTKQINIKCDSSKTGSGWNWLERWMSVSSPETFEPNAPQPDQDEVQNPKNQVETAIPSNVSESMVQIDVISIPEDLVSETEHKRSLSVDEPDLEETKSVFGSRKVSNPAFIAAQSKFEELTSNTNPSKSNNSSNPADEPDNPVPDVEPVVQNGGSECGTELSITSTLDSPDQSEIENTKFEDEPKVLEETISDTNVNNEIDIITPEPEPKPEHETVRQVSEQGSPQSHMTAVPESQGTPSSQISTNTKKIRSDKNVSIENRKSWSTSKKSSVVDSGLRSSLEQLTKEAKPGKRRNSFGSPKPDNETCVPSYMQATESAKLKAVANSSPRSSPDKETYLKKRHSLPGAVNGRQGSPRIQRSMSQALQTAKGNGNQASVTEKKWQR